MIILVFIYHTISLAMMINLEKYKTKTFHNVRPSANFINVKCTNFSLERHFGSFYYVHVTRKKLPKRRSYEKRAHFTLMKLTASEMNELLPSDYYHAYISNNSIWSVLLFQPLILMLSEEKSHVWYSMIRFQIR